MRGRKSAGVRKPVTSRPTGVPSGRTKTTLGRPRRSKRFLTFSTRAFSSSVAPTRIEVSIFTA